VGHGNWSSSGWADYAARSVRGRSRAELFGSRTMHEDYDPARIGLRESRDSAENPQATPIIIGVDVTGSMGVLAEQLVVRGLNETFTALIDRAPVPDPHVMAMAIGDAYCDRAPLQVTQFEADLRIVEQLRMLWLEGGGGGNRGESYSLAHVLKRCAWRARATRCSTSSSTAAMPAAPWRKYAARGTRSCRSG
jgi:hypothetical protein